MKKLLIIILSFLIAFSANAQTKLLGTYKIGGRDKPVFLNQQNGSIYIETYNKRGDDPFIVLKGDEIEDFKKSLIETMRIYRSMKEDSTISLGAEMPVVFKSFTVAWTVSNASYFGFKTDQKPFYSAPEQCVALMGDIVDIRDKRTATEYLILFSKEDDIQQLINLLNLNSKQEIAKGSCPSGAVDLGIRTREGKTLYWASCNLGAKSPEEIGDYYAWGEIEPRKSNFDRDHYSYSIGFLKYSKYNDSDNILVLNVEDDAAHMKLGDGWRLPTKEEYEDLDRLLFERRLYSEWTSLNGVQGYKITSRIKGHEGNWVFFPAAGYMDGESIQGRERALYWLSTLPDYRTALTTSWSSSSLGCVFTDFVDRHLGFPIRPVFVE